MSPRPRTVADVDILQAAGRVVSEMGPTRLTLADVGRACGLSAAALVKRFGSKRGLLLALSQSAVDSVDACFAAVRAQHPSPLDAFVAAALEMTKYVDTPESVANQLAYIQIDLSDPEFYALMKESSHRIYSGYQRLLDEAIASGALVRCDTARLARAVSAMTTGSLLGWAIARKGKAETWVSADLAMLLDPYRPAAARARRENRHRPPGRRQPTR